MLIGPIGRLIIRAQGVLAHRRAERKSKRLMYGSCCSVFLLRSAREMSSPNITLRWKYATCGVRTMLPKTFLLKPFNLNPDSTVVNDTQKEPA